MVIQALCRDTGLRIASERGITKPLYLIPINPISNHWLKRYMEAKAKRLQQAIETGVVPKKCSQRETWHGKSVKAIVLYLHNVEPLRNHNKLSLHSRKEPL